YKDIHNINEAPPFYINMSLLFEKYVYSLLKEKLKNTENSILYQKSYLNGRFIPDFIIKGKDYNYIADSKYKEIYINHYDKNDIMQLSGYSRIVKIIDEFKDDSEYQKNNYIPKSLIIYLNNDDDFDIDFNNIEEIKHFVKFYKIKVSLPVF
ncbi:restriction endonuclease, partial [Brachyspira intermedia]